jgi:hypothetical protein
MGRDEVRDGTGEKREEKRETLTHAG